MIAGPRAKGEWTNYPPYFTGHRPSGATALLTIGKSERKKRKAGQADHILTLVDYYPCSRELIGFRHFFSRHKRIGFITKDIFILDAFTMHWNNGYSPSSVQHEHTQYVWLENRIPYDVWSRLSISTFILTRPVKPTNVMKEAIERHQRNLSLPIYNDIVV